VTSSKKFVVEGNFRFSSITTRNCLPELRASERSETSKALFRRELSGAAAIKVCLEMPLHHGESLKSSSAKSSSLVQVEFVFMSELCSSSE
jgi:hypothetical protein